MLILSKKYRSIHYVFIFLILQITCVPFWTGYKYFLVGLVFIAFLFYFIESKTFKLDNIIILIFLIYSIIAILQGLMWDFSLLSLLSSFSFSFLFSYLLFKTYRFDFLLLFERVFKVLTVISMIIWAVQNIFPEIGKIINNMILFLHTYSTDEWPRSMLFYTYWEQLKIESYLFTRNAGFLHEPGAFAVLIVLAIYINYLKGLSFLHRKNFIYFAAMISTISTAGYLSLAILFFLLFRQKKQRFLSLLILPILLIGVYYSYNNLPFMKDKIEDQVNEQTKSSLNIGESGRIIGARKSIVVLQKYPLFGRGLNSISKPDYDSPEFAGYGWLSFVSRFGLILGALFMYYFIRGIYILLVTSGYGWYEFLIFAISIIINLSSQTYIDKPFFLIFFFFGIYSIYNSNRSLIRYERISINSNFKL